MSDVKATVCRSVLVGVLVLLAACSGSTETAATLETLAPTTSVGTSDAPTTTESTTSTTTSTTVVEVERPENVYGDYVLTWAEEGTELADVERAFWRAQDLSLASRLSIDESELERGFAGEALGWEVEEIVRIREGGWRIENDGGDEYEIRFMTKVGENMAQVEACWLDTSVWYVSSGEVASDSGVPFEVLWTSFVSRSPEGEWFVVGGEHEFDRALKEGETASCFGDSTDT